MNSDKITYPLNRRVWEFNAEAILEFGRISMEKEELGFDVEFD